MINEMKVRLSKIVCEIFDFRFRFVLVKVYIFVQQNGVRKIAPEENCPPVRVRVWFRISVRIRAEGIFPRGQFS